MSFDRLMWIMNKQEQIEYTKAYAKAVVAEVFRLAIREFLNDMKDEHEKMEQLGLTKNTPE